MHDNRSDEDNKSIAAEARRILRLAWPIILTSLNWTLMQIVDVAMVGNYGTNELAAFAASRVLTFLAIILGVSWLTGILVFASRADGDRNFAETGDIFRSGLLLGLILGLATAALLGFNAYGLLHLVGVAPALLHPGAAVVEAMVIAMPAQLLTIACAYFLEGISRPRRVMAVNLTTLPINALLAWAWVGGHLGLPALGAVGAAYATVTASWLGVALMLAQIFTLPRATERNLHDLGGAAWRRALAGVPRLAGFGLMPALGSSLELAGFAWLMVLSTQLGNQAAGAFQAMLGVHNLVFAMSIGFGSAAGVRVGNAVGAGERAEAWARGLIAGGLSILLLGTLSIFLVAFAAIWVGPFSDDEGVRSLAASMLAIIAAFLIFDGLQYVFGSALRSLGEQAWAAVNGMIGFFLVTGGGGYLLVHRGWGPTGLAYAAGIGMIACAALQFGRFYWVMRVRIPRTSARS